MVAQGFTAKNSIILSLLTVAYIVGEIAHFQIGTVSRDMAQDLEFGKKKCYQLEAIRISPFEEVQCDTFTEEIDCLNNNATCYWDWSGEGLEYQVLAGTVFTVIYSIMSVLTGFFADKLPRPKLASICILIFSLSGATMAAAQAYWHLVLLRIGIALGEAAMRPVATSLLAELFDKRSLGLANGIFSWGIYIGYGLTFVLGNYAAPDLGWRSVFLLGCVWGVPVAIALFFFSDPRNETKKEANQAVITSAKKISTAEDVQAQEIASNDSVFDDQGYWKRVFKAVVQVEFLLLLLAACVRHIAGYAWALNTQLYYDSYFSDYNPGIWFAMCSIIGGSFGVFFGGWFSDYATKRLGVHARLWILTACLGIATPFAVGVVTLKPPYLFYMLMAYYFFAETWFAILFTVMAEIVPGEVRAVVVGLFLFIMDNVGGNVAIVVDPVQEALGYRTALIIFFPCLVGISAILFFVASLPLYKKHRTEKKKLKGQK